MEIGKKLAALRNKAELSQDAVAAATGLSRAHITKLENNVNSPTVDTLAAYLKACKSSLQEFFESSIPDRYEDPVHQEMHEKLQEILISEDSAASSGIVVNINYIHSAVTSGYRQRTLSGDKSKDSGRTPARGKVRVNTAG
jgi:transcriptional regulator with XRE-family HTH domain